MYKSEIDEFESIGLIGIFEISKMNPIDWWSAAGVTVLGLTQISIGGYLIVYSCGTASSLGPGLILEGISDLHTVVKRIIIYRDFSWKEYGIEKVISLTVAIVTCGYDETNEAMKILVSGAKQVITRQVISLTVKKGWILAAKKICFMIFKKILTDIAINYLTGKLKLLIEQPLKQITHESIHEYLQSNEHLKELLECDEKNKNKINQSKIKNKAVEIMTPSTKNYHPLVRIAIGFTMGIAKKKIQNLTRVTQVIKAIQAFEELKSFLPEFFGKLTIKIKEIYEESVKIRNTNFNIYSNLNTLASKLAEEI